MVKENNVSLGMVIVVALVVSIIASIATSTLTGNAVFGRFSNPIKANSCNADNVCEAWSIDTAGINSVTSESNHTRTSILEIIDMRSGITYATISYGPFMEYNSKGYVCINNGKFYPSSLPCR